MSILGLPVTSAIAPPPDSIVSGLLDLVSGASSDSSETESGNSSGGTHGSSGTESSTSSGQHASNGHVETGGQAGNGNGAASIGTPADESAVRMEFSAEIWRSRTTAATWGLEPASAHWSTSSSA